MPKRCWLLLLSLGAMPAPAAEVLRGAAAAAVLDDVWSVAADHVYPVELRARFDRPTRVALREQLASGEPSLASVLNPFLLSLGVSHTRLYDVSDHGFYMLRSLFTTRDPDEPALYLIGVELGEHGHIRAVLDGLPAARAGLAAGDRIVTVNGTPFRSLLDWQAPEPVVLTVERGGQLRELELQPVLGGYHRALIDATRASARSIPCGAGDDKEGNAVGYLHLWTGTDPVLVDVLSAAVAASRDAGHRGFVLDLRDGYGGAWWPYLDPFFPDRASYFVARSYDDSGASEPMVAEPQDNPDHFAGALAVLINAGTRSGKESLAWQFKESGRGRLFGSTTAGAFTAGRGVFADREDAAYILYLSVAELKLDGQIVEGRGVAPDQAVAPVGGRDAPLEAALEHLGCAV